MKTHTRANSNAINKTDYRIIKTLATVMLFGLSGFSFAGMEAFTPDVVIKDYGKVAKVDSRFPIPAKMKFKVVFNLGDQGTIGDVNRKIDALARFINMHVAAGVKLEDINLALVAHGRSVIDLTDDSFYGLKNGGASNANKALVAELVKQGVRIYICGQTAAYHDVKPEHLLPNVHMALSAMTAHAILAKEGYSLNPF